MKDFRDFVETTYAGLVEMERLNESVKYHVEDESYKEHPFFKEHFASATKVEKHPRLKYGRYGEKTIAAHEHSYTSGEKGRKGTHSLSIIRDPERGTYHASIHTAHGSRGNSEVHNVHGFNTSKEALDKAVSSYNSYGK